MDSLRSLSKGAVKRLLVGLMFFSPIGAHLCAQESQWRVNFQKGAQSLGSSAVTVTAADGPILVAVALHGADFSTTSVLLDGKPVPAKLAGYDAVSRLCFFKPVKADDVPAAAWSSAAPGGVGTRFTVGRGNGTQTAVLRGWVKSLRGKVLPLALLRVEVGGRTPAPGTPLIGADGKVAAIVFQKESDGIYAIPAEAVHRVLKDITVSGRLVRGWLGVSLLVEDQTPRITRVWPASPAADAGIREQDLIVQIGRRPVGDYADVANAFFYLVPGEPVDLSVMRGARELRFTLTPTAERPK